MSALLGFLQAGSGWLAGSAANIPLSGLIGRYDAKVSASVGAAPTRDWTNQAVAEIASGNGTIDYISQRNSLLFEGQSIDWYDLPSIVSAPPFTVIAGVTPQPQIAANQVGTIWSASNLGTANRWFKLGTDAGGDYVVESRNGGTVSGMIGMDTPAGGNFEVIAGEFAADNSRRLKYNNTAWQTNADSVTVDAISRNHIARLEEQSNFIEGFRGEIHWILIYNRVLTDQEHTDIYNWGQRNSNYDIDRDSNGYAIRDSNGNVKLVLKP